MTVVDASTTTTNVRRQYETFPFPHRDPAKESGDLKVCDLDDLNMLNHYCFRGRRDYRHGFRVLIAGGGTGDSTIFLAHQLAGTDASIVHLDLSDASIEIARRRARQRNLEEKISWVQGSLLELPTSGLGPFDYINCCGVLHHLDDPQAGLAALKSVLHEDGALGLSIYGRSGRAGIYQMQELMRLVNHDQCDPRSMVANARQTLAALPATNWLRRVPHHLPPDEQMDDGNIYDMFLHAKDQPSSVAELYDSLDRAGLHLAEFARTYRELYNPRFTFRPGKLRAQVEKLPTRQQQAAAELFWGIISKHMFWAASRPDTTADPRNPENVPMLTAAAREARLREAVLDRQNENWSMEVAIPGSVKISIRLVLTDQTRRLIELIDGHRTTGDIVQTLVKECASCGSTDEAWKTCLKVLETLRTFDAALLRHTSVPEMNAA